MRGHREDKRRARLSAEHRCWGCAEKLAFDDIARYHYCAPCRANTEADVWRLYCEGEMQRDIAVAVDRAPSMVSEIVHRLERSQADTSTFVRDDGIPRCRCGLRIDKDHLVCDLYGGVSRSANDRRGVGHTYPGTPR